MATTSSGFRPPAAPHKANLGTIIWASAPAAGSLLAYTAYLGHAQLAHATPNAAPTGDALPAYVDTVIATLTAR